MTVPVAFYAPLKSPRHPNPSGDRTVARLMLRALEGAGFAPTLVSESRTLDLRGDPAVQAALRDASREEADRIAAGVLAGPASERPRLWFTYHCHYKAPDWIGPRVADALGIPYVAAEGSRAGKRAGGPWALGHAGAEAALDRADVLFASTARDAEALRERQRPGQALIDLRPFLDAALWPVRVGPRTPGPVRLLAVGMMRAGDKLHSYRLLAEALGQPCVPAAWTLSVVGDGPERPAVEALLAPFGERVSLHGQLDEPALAALYREADLLVWPAVNEAYGMTLLEAQASGCPVLAGREGGVEAVVRDGETSFLTRPRDPAAFAASLADLAASPRRLAALGRAAAGFVRAERDLAAAASTLRSVLRPLVDHWARAA